MNQNLLASVVRLGIVLILISVCHRTLHAQGEPASDTSDAPRTIDPATLIADKLAEKASVDLSDSSLRELVDWLQTEHGLVVLLDKNELARIRVSPAEPIDDRLEEAPLYLLLNRLSILNIDWFFANESQ